jgi:hypothetical protein
MEYIAGAVRICRAAGPREHPGEDQRHANLYEAEKAIRIEHFHPTLVRRLRRQRVHQFSDFCRVLTKVERTVTMPLFQN